MAGIYVHIPFCKQKCSYCDFHFSTTFEKYRKQMIDAICKEIELRAPLFLSNEPINTIYFGGGTPSILHQHELHQILSTIHTYTNSHKVEEITLEANPDDITDENLDGWKQEGINRLSIGVQSFREQDLQWMNRAHTVNEGKNALLLAQKHGFDNLTVDLIYGLPNLSNKEWTNHIQRLIELKIPHISAYCLTVEKKTALHKMVQHHELKMPDDEIQAQQFEILLNTLEKAGYEQYEISNFSFPEHHSKHNSNYWKNENYLGIGPSAHSYDGKNRYWNFANNSRYIQSIEQNSQHYELEQLTPENRFNELLLTGLRTKWGVNKSILSSISTLTTDFNTKLNDFIFTKDIEMNENEQFYLTTKGKLKADYIASELFV
jgi:oxygen-independent coproporphyrinogen III oxidase